MNERIEHCLYQAGLTAQGCWDELDDYAKEGIEKFAELIVQRTLAIVEAHTEIFQSDQARAMVEHIKQSVKTDFGVEE